MSIWSVIIKSAQTITGEWNFTGGLKVNGVDVTTGGGGTTNFMEICAALGSGIIAHGVYDIKDYTASVLILNQTMKVCPPFVMKEAGTITGLKWWMTTAGDYTPNNYNGIGIMSYSAGTLTLVASSTNDGNIWKQGTATMAFKAFSAPYSAAAGIYFPCFLYCRSAEVTTPNMRAAVNIGFATIGIMDFTNSAKFSSQLTAQTSLPASVAFSSLSVVNSNPIFFPY